MFKHIFIIAGPNGAGKTTNAKSLIPDLNTLYEFVNADKIAGGLAPMRPESVALTASKLMIKRLRELLSLNKNFAFETTAAGTNYLKYLRQARSKGYEINLLFLWLSSPDLAINRVAQRVNQGGHHVPNEIVRRRYYSGIKNLIKHYLPIADKALILDNSNTEQRKNVAYKNNQKHFKIEDPKTWEEIAKLAHG
ncbi:MAG: AAA family ATPase [Parachlamydiales bacterium]|jgi:predicted ABC-type ATPase